MFVCLFLETIPGSDVLLNGEKKKPKVIYFQRENISIGQFRSCLLPRIV